MSKFLAGFKNVEDMLEAIPDAVERLSLLMKHLSASEAQLVELINAVVSGKEYAVLPAGAEGELEFGLALYWLQHPTDEHVNAMKANNAISIATQTLQRFAPSSNITKAMFISLSGISYKGYVAEDGTLYTLGKYAQLDPEWLFAAVNYAVNLLDPGSIHPFYTTPYSAAIDDGKSSVSIAIIGDWGTGVYDSDYDGRGPAVAVMNAVKKLQPDYVVHLGDVYYCGTDKDRLPANEEQNNFLAQWNTGTGENTCFAINSNHEMYGAAQGLIGVALAKDTPFEHQNRTTYFGLEFGDWVILGLDSAYFDPSQLYMDGALGNAKNTQQQDFIAETYPDLSNKKVFVMTHHNPMSYDGASLTPNESDGINLWDGMNTALGGRNPDVWYWGHLHLGIAYNKNSVVGQKGTLARCVGHSAIPYGNASGMIAENVDYYAHTALGINTRQVQNGFAMVTLGVDGSLLETFYEVDVTGKHNPIWTSL